MSSTTDTPPKPTTERPKLYKVILLNDDFTAREFVVSVLKRGFRMSEGETYGVMLTAHQQGACVVAVYTKEVANTKAQETTERGQRDGFPLAFTAKKED